VISDAYTARVVGLVMIFFVVIIDVSMSMFSRVPGSPVFPFALYASLPSVPFLAIGTYLIVRAKRFDKD
jgi:lipopolysaccharide export LptBFGC system permease protein LptF